MALLNISLLQPFSNFGTALIGMAVCFLVPSVAGVIYNVYFHPLAKFPDIYGKRTGKGQLAKDKRIYQPGPAPDIIAANDADHARIRKLLSHGFSETALREQEPILISYFDLLVSRLQEQIDGSTNGKVDIMSWYNFTTFDIIGDLVLGDSFHALQNGDYHIWMRNMFESVKFLSVMSFAATYPAIDRIFKFMVLAVPSMADKRKSHFDFTRKQTEKRLDNDVDRKDVTSYILRFNDERGMTRQEIIGNSGIMLVAGSETTATLLSGATYQLLTNPAVLKKLQLEVRGAFKSGKEMSLLSVGNPGLLPYMEAVLTESLRMYPPVPASLPRVTGPDGEIIDGQFVPANTSVGVHQWSTYHTGTNFADPDLFVPERWLPEPPERYRNDQKAALQPFSMGPRNCLGKNLAWFEMRSILARMMWHFDMTLCRESNDWTQQKAYLLWDKPPLWVELTHRV
ncbi:cytochrome P450 monooxygenase [Physcia stellaris]|nr:cytochrome P450 monooxygenase [Physcia stellaris]